MQRSISQFIGANGGSAKIRAKALLFTLIFASWGFVGTGQAAETPASVLQVYRPGTGSQDVRLAPPKDYDGYFPFTPPKALAVWKTRREAVRHQVLVATGLFPLPPHQATRPVVHSRVERDDFTVDRVFFESYPGHFVTGSLFLPKGAKGKSMPAVLCPHGHFPLGRFTNEDDAVAKQQVADGAERSIAGGHSPLQARCVTLARMGCAALMYDMVGFADSVQLSHAETHWFQKQRPGMDQPDAWGFLGVQAELRSQSIMGLQTYNSLCALDFLLAQPGVDPKRIGVTGESGGGTQTFILTAVDDRVTAAFPAVMVGTAMQGGCTCENCCYLRVATGNVELAGLFAPKPLGMSGADDWTVDLETKGLPQLKELFALYNAADMVTGKTLRQFPHNYNYVSRELMYQWFNKHLELELPSPVIEEDFKLLSVPELTVWNKEHPKPAGGHAYEKSLLQEMQKASDASLASVYAKQDATEVRAAAYRVLFNLPPDDVKQQYAFDANPRTTHSKLWLTTGIVRHTTTAWETPVAVFEKVDAKPGKAVLWITEQGKQSALDAKGEVTPEIRELCDAGFAVWAIDLFRQGEAKPADDTGEQIRRVPNPREVLSYTLGYNESLFSQRVKDIMAVARVAHDRGAKQVLAVGLDGKAGIWATAAAALCPDVTGAAVDTHSFRFTQLTSIFDGAMLPGITRYDDVLGLLESALSLHDSTMWIGGEHHPQQSKTPAELQSLTSVMAAGLWKLMGGPDFDAMLSKLPEGPERRAEALAWIKRQAK